MSSGDLANRYNLNICFREIATLIQESIHLVGREELLHIGLVRSRAERSRRSHQPSAAERRELRLHPIPVFLDIRPRQPASLRTSQQPRDQPYAVLVAHLPTGSIIKRPL